MAKQKAAPYMTSGEQWAGTILFLLYLVVLPFAADSGFALCEKLLGAAISPALRSGLYYGIPALACLVIFHGFLSRTTHNLFENFAAACKAALLGLVVLYGVNELICRLGGLLGLGFAGLNDVPISAQIQDAPRFAVVITVFVAPFVEEMLFRGLVFGCLKGRSRTAAYVLSCLLFALLRVWDFAAAGVSLTAALRLVRYLFPGAVLAWSYDRSGTLWASIALHALFNALAL